MDVEHGPATPAADDTVAAIGPMMRDLRRQKGLTLAQLAERTGLSIGHISQVERGLSTPTIKQLQDISAAMGVRIGWFFEAVEQPSTDNGPVVRARERKALHYGKLGITDYLLVPDLAHSLELLLCVLEPGAASGDDAYQHDGEEAGLVLEGALELWVGERRFLLQEGDSFAFPSTTPHRYRNPGTTTTRIVWAVTPPTF